MWATSDLPLVRRGGGDIRVARLTSSITTVEMI